MKSILEKLLRPDTHDEAASLSDHELKNAVNKATAELVRRGWDVETYGAIDGIINFSKRVDL